MREITVTIAVKLPDSFKATAADVGQDIAARARGSLGIEYPELGFGYLTHVRSVEGSEIPEDKVERHRHPVFSAGYDEALRDIAERFRRVGDKALGPGGAPVAQAFADDVEQVLLARWLS